jgi:hypothetical protein
MFDLLFVGRRAAFSYIHHLLRISPVLREISEPHLPGNGNEKLDNRQFLVDLPLVELESRSIDHDHC